MAHVVVEDEATCSKDDGWCVEGLEVGVMIPEVEGTVVVPF